jgi:hypothetical protein
MYTLMPILINALVIIVVSAQLLLLALGMTSTDQLLIVSATCGGLTILSLRVARMALAQMDRAPGNDDKRATGG